MDPGGHGDRPYIIIHHPGEEPATSPTPSRIPPPISKAITNPSFRDLFESVLIGHHGAWISAAPVSVIMSSSGPDAAIVNREINHTAQSRYQAQKRSGALSATPLDISNYRRKIVTCILGQSRWIHDASTAGPVRIRTEQCLVITVPADVLVPCGAIPLQMAHWWWTKVCFL